MISSAIGLTVFSSSGIRIVVSALWKRSWRRPESCSNIVFTADSMDDAWDYRIGDEERRLMHLVPAPAVRLMKRRVLSRPGLNSLMSLLSSPGHKKRKVNELLFGAISSFLSVILVQGKSPPKKVPDDVKDFSFTIHQQESTHNQLWIECHESSVDVWWRLIQWLSRNVNHMAGNSRINFHVAIRIHNLYLLLSCSTDQD